jgi:hypothetical protein
MAPTLLSASVFVPFTLKWSTKRLCSLISSTATHDDCRDQWWSAASCSHCVVQLVTSLSSHQHTTTGDIRFLNVLIFRDLQILTLAALAGHH